MIEDRLRLKDGRWLGYGIYGNPQGTPVFDFHGIPGSRGEARLIADYLSLDEVCLVGFDRPGYGRSSVKRGFRVRDLPEDVVQLANHLGFARFAGLGYSGGGPFALACAWQIPERLSALAIVSGVGPPEIGSAGMHESNRKKFNLAQRLPWLTRLLLRTAFSPLRRHPERLENQLQKIWQQMPEPDRLVLQDQRFAGGILQVTQDAILNGVSGWANEEVLMASPWGFDLSEVRCPNIMLWHGELDRNVPLAMGKAVAERLPVCRARFVAQEGHISLLYHHGREIIEELTQFAA